MESIFPTQHISGDALTYCLLLCVWLWLWNSRGQRDFTRWTDLCFYVGLLLWRNCQVLVSTIGVRSAGPLVGCATLTIIATNVLYSWLYTPHVDESAKGEAPWLLPSRTTHTRLFPKRHSFGYSYLQAAIPVGYEGRFGSLISVGAVKRKCWYHVQASDYLERNSKDESLKTKLRVYLHSQGVGDSEWEYAHLITAPRFLGYSFNPVSFWYIYTKENILNMMILEVNNTFDERRIYLLRAKDSEEKSQDSQSDPPTPVEEPSDLPLKFHKAWAKDFHVSPFSSRKGYYVLTANDPFHATNGDAPEFHNSITLKSSKNHVKLVARVFSAGKAINPLTANRREMASFIVLWFWVGFMTFPRILKEAAVLFWARGLHVWFRPEIMPTSIGRREEPVETELGAFFESYLKAMTQKYTKPIRVVYTSHLEGSTQCTYVNTSTDLSSEEHEHVPQIEIRVLSPAFFGRFIHYAHTSEAFDRECIFTDERNRTIWLTRPDLLSQLIKTDVSKVIGCNTIKPLGFMETVRWNVHKFLRCPPVTPAYSFSDVSMRVEDIRKLDFSPLDRFIMAHHQDEAWKYRRLCGRLFLARRFAFGFVPVIDMLDFMFRFMLLLLFISISWRQHQATSLILANAVHVYAFIKGI